MTAAVKSYDNRPIGVFDSGIGGLTAMKDLIRLLPNEDILYFGDTARVPYGSHSKETIIRYARQDLSFLLSRNVKAVLVACGTASATALTELRGMTKIPVMGVIDAAAEAAVRAGARRVAVLATGASVRSRAYSEALNGLDPGIRVMEKACPLFVPLIENGYADCGNPVTRMVIRDYLDAIRLFEPEAVILGCTHYPLLKEGIRAELPEAVIVESGKEAAIALADEINSTDLRAEPDRKGERRYAVSEITDSFRETCELFLGESIGEQIEVVRFDLDLRQDDE